MKAVRVALVNDLRAAVEARARARQLRPIRAGQSSNPDAAPRQERSLKRRIADREARCTAVIRELRIQARILIADRAELRDVLLVLRGLGRTYRQHAARHHQVFDLPAHRPGDVERQFRADCQQAMKRHHVGATEAATVIVRRIAPGLPDRARTGLLGPWGDEREQIQHLADVIRKPV